jgi:type IV pilus assembly protein PilO
MNIPNLKNIDWQALSNEVAAQFKNLDPQNPGLWPLLPRLGVWLAAASAAVALIWYALITAEQEAVVTLKNEEVQLREEFRKKTRDSINLGELKKQKQQVQEYVSQLENQLPGKAEMAKLLSDVNQAGVSQGLQFELFKPSPEVVKGYYAERSVNVAVTGRFHDIGEFSASIARLPRIVSLSHLVLVLDPVKDILRMEAIVHTYRYLDDTEAAEAKKKEAEKKAGGTPK